MTKATLEIRVWTKGKTPLPDDLSETLAPHVKHVAKACEEGYQSGEIVDNHFAGWWEIKREPQE